MSQNFGRKAQATTEMAVLATILLLAFAAMIKWGQIMNAQQEVTMLTFRKALAKAYTDYRGGSGYGGASYRTIDHLRLVEPFNKYYTGRQRQSVSGGNTIFWDPDILYADEGDKPNTYYNVDGLEINLGSELKVWDVADNSVTMIEDLRLERITDEEKAEDYVHANIHQINATILRTETEAGSLGLGPVNIPISIPVGGVPIVTYQDYSKDETWTTPWQ